MDGRAESIYEGLLRMLHVACGVPVEPQYVVLDGTRQHRGARATSGSSATNRLPEYDGADSSPAPTAASRSPSSRPDPRRGFERRGYTEEDVLLGAMSILRDADRALGPTARPGADPGVARPAARLAVLRRWSTAAAARLGLDGRKRGTDAPLTAGSVDMFRVFRPFSRRSCRIGSQAMTSWIIGSQSAHSCSPGRRSRVTSTPAAVASSAKRSVPGSSGSSVPHPRYSGGTPDGCCSSAKRSSSSVTVPPKTRSEEVAAFGQEHQRPQVERRRRARRPRRTARDG